MGSKKDQNCALASCHFERRDATSFQLNFRAQAEVRQNLDGDRLSSSSRLLLFDEATSRTDTCIMGNMPMWLSCLIRAAPVTSNLPIEPVDN